MSCIATFCRPASRTSLLSESPPFGLSGSPIVVLAAVHQGGGHQGGGQVLQCHILKARVAETSSFGISSTQPFGIPLLCPLGHALASRMDGR